MSESVFQQPEQNWQKIAKHYKETFLKLSPFGTLPPMVITERNEKAVMVAVFPPHSPPEAVMASARLMQICCDSDALTMVFDSKMEKRERDPNDEPTGEIDEKEFHKILENFDEGNSLTCLSAHRIERSTNNIKSVIWPYKQDGKNFEWSSEKDLVLTEEENGAPRGLIIDKLKEIIQVPWAAELIPHVKDVVSKFKFDKDKARFFTTRAIISILSGIDVIAIDLVTWEHPEWAGANEKLDISLAFYKNIWKLPDAFMKESESLSPLVGMKSFHQAAFDLFWKYNAFMPEVLLRPENLHEFIDEFHYGLFRPVKPEGQEQSIKRVKVWNGDRSEYLGMGTFVGHADVYVVIKNQAIVSASDAEHAAPPLKDGEILQKINNPKIILDSGRTVYGCQVWWDDVAETAKPVSSPQYGDFGFSGMN